MVVALVPALPGAWRTDLAAVDSLDARLIEDDQMGGAMSQTNDAPAPIIRPSQATTITGCRAFPSMAFGAALALPVARVYGQEPSACVAPTVQPTPRRSLRVDRGPAECNRVALTFDAGLNRG